MPARKPMTFRDEINTRISLVLVQLERIKSDSSLEGDALLEAIQEAASDLETVEAKVQKSMREATFEVSL